MRGSFTSGVILKSYQETERNFKNVHTDSVRGGRDTSRVAIAVDGIDVPQIGTYGVAYYLNNNVIFWKANDWKW